MTTQPTGAAELQEALTEDQWLDLAQRHVMADCNSDEPDGYLNAIKAVCADYTAQVEALRAQPAGAMPEGWVPLVITHEGQHPEEVAYGPQVMMDRLGKWLRKYFDFVVVTKALTAEVAPDLQRLHDLLYAAQRQTTLDGYHSAITAARVELSKLRESAPPTARAATPAPGAPSDADIAELRAQFGITSDGRGIKEFSKVADFARAVLAHWGAQPAGAATPAAPAPGATLGRDQIRAIFMQHGFTIKEGQTDLKQYVYDAADALLAAHRGGA